MTGYLRGRNRTMDFLIAPEINEFSEFMFLCFSELGREKGSTPGIWQRLETKLAISPQLIDSEWDSDSILSGKLFAKRSFDDNAQS